MEFLTNIGTKFLKGQSIVPEARRILNLILNISIASHMYEYYYGSYTWIIFSDYKLILDFMIKGQFLIPLCFFIIAYLLTQFVSWCVFWFFVMWRLIKVKNRIIAYEYDSTLEKIGLLSVKKVTQYSIREDVDDEKMITFYHEIRTEIKPESFDQMDKELKEPKKIIEQNFQFFFRLLIAIIIYKFHLDNFGTYLFTIMFVIIGLILFYLVLNYKVLDVIPLVLKKIHERVESIITNDLNRN